MGAIASILSKIFAWFGANILARWTYSLALAAGVLATYAAVYAVFIAAVAALVSLIPASPFTAFTLQFFPSSYAVGIAVSAYFGSLATKKAASYWLAAYVNASKVAS